MPDSSQALALLRQQLNREPTLIELMNLMQRQGGTQETTSALPTGEALPSPAPAPAQDNPLTASPLFQNPMQPDPGQLSGSMAQMMLWELLQRSHIQNRNPFAFNATLSSFTNPTKVSQNPVFVTSGE